MEQGGNRRYQHENSIGGKKSLGKELKKWSQVKNELDGKPKKNLVLTISALLCETSAVSVENNRTLDIGLKRLVVMYS